MNLVLAFLSKKKAIFFGGFVLVAILLLLVSISVAASGSPHSSANGTNVIKIGIAADMSGPGAFIGWRQVNSAQLVVNRFNNEGGIDINGVHYNLALVSADSQCNPSAGLTAANTLIGAGIVAVIGHTCSSASMVGAPLYGAAGIAMITGSSTAPQLTEQGFTNVFRVISRDDDPPGVLATYLRNQLHFSKMAIVKISGYYTNYLADATRDAFTNLGGTVTSENSVADSSQFNSTLTAIKAQNPDAVIFAHDDPTITGRLSKEGNTLGMTNVVFSFIPGTENRTFLENHVAGADARVQGAPDKPEVSRAEGNLVLMHYRNTADMPGYTDFNTAYVAAGFPNYGTDADMWGAYAADAARIIIEALVKANSTNPSDIRNAIANTSGFDGVVGTYDHFNNKGDISPTWYWMEQYVNGTWVKKFIYTFYNFLPILSQSTIPNG